jgi:hypothetical protein
VLGSEELNAALVRRTGMAGSDFERADQRAAMGYLLVLIVENDHARTGFMLSALVRYLDANDAGLGFYSLATQLGLLPRSASARAKEGFWVRQVNALHDHYSHVPGSPVDCAERSAESPHGEEDGYRQWPRQPRVGHPDGCGWWNFRLPRLAADQL